MDAHMVAGKPSEADLLEAIANARCWSAAQGDDVAVIFAGLLRIMWGAGTGSEVMRRIVTPMVGGMITAPLRSIS